MLLCFWSPKGGSGTSIVAAACALVVARDGAARLADLIGDQPAVLGAASDPPTGVREWLRVGVDAPVDALDRLSVEVAPGLTLLPAGRAPIGDVPPEAGAALGVALRDDPRPTVADVGVPDTPAAEALLDVADANVVVVRGCYVTLRRAVRMEATARAAGAVLVDEPGRALGAREVADVLGVPVLASVPVRSQTARIVDAGVLATRLPEGLAKPARQVIARLGCTDHEGRAA